MQEIWVEERGSGRLEFSRQLGEMVAVREGSGRRLACRQLQLEAELLNVVDCRLSMRYAGETRWQELRLPDQRCESLEDLALALKARMHVIDLSVLADSVVELAAVGYASSPRTIEFKLSTCLAAILGIPEDRTYSAPVRGTANIYALVDRVAVLSPIVTPSVSLNSAEIRSLGIFRLPCAGGRPKKTDCGMGWLISPHRTAGPNCLPGLHSRLTFTINSLLCPSLVLRAHSFRLLACMVLSE